MVTVVRVGCPNGHLVATRVRGRSTKCGQCGRSLYVRADGTSRFDITEVVSKPRKNPRRPLVRKGEDYRVAAKRLGITTRELMARLKEENGPGRDGNQG